MYYKIKFSDIAEHIEELNNGAILTWSGWKIVNDCIKSKKTKSDYLKNHSIRCLVKWLNTYWLENWIIQNSAGELHYYKDNDNMHEYLHNGWVYNDPDFVNDNGATFELKEAYDFEDLEAKVYKHNQEMDVIGTDQYDPKNVINLHNASYGLFYIIKEKRLYIFKPEEDGKIVLSKFECIIKNITARRIHFKDWLHRSVIKDGNFEDYFIAENIII